MSTATAPAAVRPRPRGDAPYAVVGRPRNEGHGKRLTAAFEALEVFPALAESRNRLLALVNEERPSTGDVVRAIESDVALVISVMRLANGLDSPKRGQVESVVTSVEVLSPEAVQRLAQGMVYKQIAHELSLSTSTVRSHLHNIYGKLGAVDRAQAVLHATERGWL